MSASLRFRVAMTAACSLLLLAPVIPVRADILVLTNGERREGVVTPAPGDPEAIMFQDSTGQVKIARNRIRSVEQESEATNLSKIGDQFYLRKRFEQALQSYKKAQELKPGDAGIAERIQKAEAALESTATSARHEQLVAIDTLLDQGERAVKDQQFETAQGILYKRAPDMAPSAKQDERILELKKRLQRAWAKERYDKLARDAAAQHFEELLKLDPSDKEAFDYLLEIWSKMPEKTDQVIEAYNVRLRLNPEDKLARKNLADKYLAQGNYPKALENYETLYKSGNFRDSEVSKNVVICLKALYKEAQSKQDFDGAIAYYKRLQAYSDTFDAGELVQLQFWRDWFKSDPKDVETRTSLTLWARSQGLNSLALSKLNELKAQSPENPSVLNALRLYADESLGKAQAAWQASKASETSLLANQTIRDYGYFPDIKESATQLVGMANVELAKQRRQKKDVGMESKRQADQYYGMGVANLESMRNKEVSSNVRVISDKQNAIDNFNLAIQFYDQAVNYWPEMDDATRVEVQTNRNKAQSYYDMLTNPNAPALPQTSRSRGY